MTSSLAAARATLSCLPRISATTSSKISRQAAAAHDTIQFSKTVFDSFASVLSHASQVGQDVVISTGSDTLTLKNTKLSALNSHDFHFA